MHVMWANALFFFKKKEKLLYGQVVISVFYKLSVKKKSACQTCLKARHFLIELAIFIHPIDLLVFFLLTLSCISAI